MAGFVAGRAWGGCGRWVRARFPGVWGKPAGGRRVCWGKGSGIAAAGSLLAAAKAGRRWR